MDILSQLFVAFRDEPKRLNEVLYGITEVVGGSFIADGSTMTLNEIKRRTKVCAKWLLVLREELGWAYQRALDELPKALRCELDGIPYSPSREGKDTWSADNGRDLLWLPT